MQLIQAFNAQQYDPTQGVGALPIGKHPVVVESSEVKANKANDGGYLQLNLRIIDGPQAGAVGAYRLNLYHSNTQTVEIANRQLSAICHVIGVFQVNNSEQLHNLPFIVEVGPQKNDPQYTEVKKVFDIKGNEPQRAGAQEQQQQQQAAPAQAQQQQQQTTAATQAAWGNPAPTSQQASAAWQQPGAAQSAPAQEQQQQTWQQQAQPQAQQTAAAAPWAR